MRAALLLKPARALEVAAARTLWKFAELSLGFVEGLNNKIGVIQRHAYGLRDEEYLRYEILTQMLPAL